MALCSDALAVGWSGVISFPGLQVLDIPWTFCVYLGREMWEISHLFCFSWWSCRSSLVGFTQTGGFRQAVGKGLLHSQPLNWAKRDLFLLFAKVISFVTVYFPGKQMVLADQGSFQELPSPFMEV